MNIEEQIGVYFELPKDSENHIRIDEILSVIDYRKLQWEVTNCETYVILNDKIQSEDLFEEIDIISGVELDRLLKSRNYYTIFLSLRGFPISCTYEEIKNTHTTNLIEFKNSHCAFYFMIIDSYEIVILSKDKKLLEMAYSFVKKLGYINVRLVDESEKWYLE